MLTQLVAAHQNNNYCNTNGLCFGASDKGDFVISVIWRAGLLN